MVRTVACACVLLALALLLATEPATAQQAKNQMVRGTIKQVDLGKSLLVINQKLKDQVVDRELSILDTTEFVVTKGANKQQFLGKDGLRLLEGHEGTAVQVKCDKDVNVLRVTVKLKESENK